MGMLLETAENPITVGIATTAKEKREIYRFRYRVYVEEMGMRLSSVDYHNKLLYDELDKWGVLLYATDGSQIIGTQRINIGPLAAFPPDLARILSLDKFLKFSGEPGKQHFSYTSKLIVAPHYRNSAVLHLLTAKGYELYCQHQVQFNFGVCNFHLLRLYEQFGCRRFGRSFAAPGYDGVLVPFVIFTDDVEHFRAVRSPFYRLARKRGTVNSRVADWFYREFPEHARIINSQLVSEEELWAILHKYLRRAPQQVMPVLRGLSEREARQLLHCCGVIIPCRAGDWITIRGYESYILGILLAGKLKSPDFTGSGADAVQPGQCFGTAGLAGRPKYAEDIFAATDAEILVLSRLNFQRFQRAHPDIAGKVLQNIASLADNRYVRVSGIQAGKHRAHLRNETRRTLLSAKRTRTGRHTTS